MIGIDGGATFLNNYVAGTFDYVSRIAGMLLVNGKMDNIRNVAALVPVYLVNPSDAVLAKYKKANDVDAYMTAGSLETYFHQALPLKKVVVARDQNPDAARYIKDALLQPVRQGDARAGHQAGPLHRLHAVSGLQLRRGSLFPVRPERRD